jgi:hypothetical protein
MTKLTQKQIVAILTPWVTHKLALDAAFAPLNKYMSVGNPLSDAVWAIFYVYTEAIEMQVGDAHEWLDWYACENDMGKSGMQASPGAGVPMRKIRNLADLAWLIVGVME